MSVKLSASQRILTPKPVKAYSTSAFASTNTPTPIRRSRRLSGGL
jgi:hypothetical protein